MSRDSWISMTNPPQSDPTRITANLNSQLELLERPVRIAILTLATHTLVARAWVGVLIEDVSMTVTIEQDSPPTRAQMLQQGDSIRRKRPSTHRSSSTTDGTSMVANFDRARKGGWVTIKDGYAFPTQKLADFLNKN